ncbi:hypothetical protein AB7W62_14280 [Morganella morganii]|uniref:hypothetical protein n=1 Tax=Morganella morganii TaxID=582 RepID=UPI0034E60767
MKNPKLIVKPFAKNGQKNVIPENYETSMEGNQATWDQGFGQITMLPVTAGGLPPKGQDFNGIFNQISESIVYLSQGGRFKFSAEYAEAIGGYPKGAILQSDDEKKEYLSLIDNNKVNFNTASQDQIKTSWKLVMTDDLLDQLSKKLESSAVVQTTGQSTTNVMSQKAVTDSFQPKGNYQAAGYSYSKSESDTKYQPKGDYATNTALNNGLALKLDKTGGTITGDVTFSKNAVKSTGGTHTLPDKSGKLMQVGDFGVGSLAGFYKVEPFEPENPFGGTGATKLMSPPGGNSYQASICWTQGGKLRLAGFATDINGNKGEFSEFYSTTNTTKDSNGFLRTGSATALTTGQVVQTTGTSTANVMSQKAVTDAIYGVGQSWKDVTSERSSGTAYTNTTGRPISVSLTQSSAEQAVYLDVSVNDVIISKASSSSYGAARNTITFTVPSGNAYKVVATGAGITVWAELR